MIDSTRPEKGTVVLSMPIAKDVRGILRDWHITAAKVWKHKEQRWGESDHFP